MSKKIGMCCACGGYTDKNKSVIVAGMEMCPECAEPFDADEEEEEEDESLVSCARCNKPLIPGGENCYWIDARDDWLCDECISL